GGPLVSTAPRSMATTRSASSAMNAMSCSTTSMVASSRSRTVRSRPTIASTSRWATPEEGSSSRTTEGWCATTAARSTRRREEVEELVDALHDGRFGAYLEGQAQHGVEGVADVGEPFQRDGHGVAHGQAG